MNYRILLIEDDQEYADFLGRGLSYEGYDVCHCYSAEAGMKELNRYDPDAILLDVMLPGMDGLTTGATAGGEIARTDSLVGARISPAPCRLRR